jgi:hypothetical protein
MNRDLVSEFEEAGGAGLMDETDRTLRAYVARVPADRLARYRTSMSDEEVMAWDGNFRSDGALMLVCCERDVDVAEFRRVVEEFLAFRQGRKDLPI